MIVFGFISWITGISAHTFTIHNQTNRTGAPGGVIAVWVHTVGKEFIFANPIKNPLYVAPGQSITVESSLYCLSSIKATYIDTNMKAPVTHDYWDVPWNIFVCCQSRIINVYQRDYQSPERPGRLEIVIEGLDRAKWDKTRL